MTDYKCNCKITAVESSYTIVVTDSDILSKICGSNDSNLRLIEEHLGVPVFTKGNELSVSDADAQICSRFKQIIGRITTEVEDGAEAGSEMISSILRSSDSAEDANSFYESHIQIPDGFKRIYPKNKSQSELIRGMNLYDMVFCLGPAGTGKTFLVVAYALYLLLSRKKRKIILTRPVVEAGESLGFLPGDLEQKINPYLRPLYDAMESLIPREVLRKLYDAGMIEVAPLAYMRGRTLDNSVILLDEAQNTTVEQMKMFLTRMGEGSKVFVTGDVTQIDLPKRIESGLVNAVSVLQPISEIFILKMQAEDVVRNSLVKKIIKAYEKQH